MNDNLDNTIADTLGNQLSRRTAITSFAGAGALAALAGASKLSGSSVSASQLGVLVTDATPAAVVAPTVVLVHGAWADGSSWNGVITSLVASGISVIATPNALRGIASDAADLVSVLAAIPEPVVLAGHSYGGAVITNAASQASNVVALVYVAAFAPDEGEVLQGILGQFAPTPLGAALRPANANEAAPDLIIDRAQFPALFAADVPIEVASVMALTQRSAAASGFGEPSGVPAWKTLPSWFAVATADQAIGAEAERFMAQRAGSTTVEIDASHAITVSQPEAIADLIRTAVTAVS